MYIYIHIYSGHIRTPDLESHLELYTTRAHGLDRRFAACTVRAEVGDWTDAPSQAPRAFRFPTAAWSETAPVANEGDIDGGPKRVTTRR